MLRNFYRISLDISFISYLKILLLGTIPVFEAQFSRTCRWSVFVLLSFWKLIRCRSVTCVFFFFHSRRDQVPSVDVCVCQGRRLQCKYISFIPTYVPYILHYPTISQKFTLINHLRLLTDKFETLFDYFSWQNFNIYRILNLVRVRDKIPFGYLPGTSAL